MVGERLECTACGKDTPLTDADRAYLKTHPLAAFQCPSCTRELERTHRDTRQAYEEALRQEYDALCWDRDVGPLNLSVWPDRGRFSWSVSCDEWRAMGSRPTRAEAVECASVSARERLESWAREAGRLAASGASAAPAGPRGER